jgi:hypothetical protein
MKTFVLAVGLCAPVVAFAQKAQPEDLNNTNEPPRLGIHWARGFEPSARASEEAKAPAPARRSPNMTYNGGKIMPTVKVVPIFWGTTWANYTGDEISGMDLWYQGFGGSNYANASSEYSDSSGQYVTAAVNYALGSYKIDFSPSTGGGSTSAILNEVCKVITDPDTSGNGYYPVYTDTPRGNGGYCAWHSYGSCKGTTVQIAFFFKLDGDAGCDPQSTVKGESQGLAAMANVSGHELSEARTDPASPGAWYDRQGNENGDKCAWTFGAPYVTFTNNTQWKIQGEWSNAAYNADTGYPNSSGQRGCLSGQ